MYVIKSWSKTFENCNSRKLKRLEWIQTPAGVESNGCIELVSRGVDGLAALGVFTLLCQWTATQPPTLRGKLCRTGGQALTVSQIATHIRADAETTKRAIDLLKSPEVGWIEEIEEGTTTVIRSTHDEDLPPPYNQALDYGTPERLPVDTSGPIPFGIPADAIEEIDWLRIETAFIDVWNAKDGLLKSGNALTASNQRAFQTRCRTPGWLALAEMALNKFPTPWHKANAPQKLTLKKFLEDDEAASAIADGGRYSGTGKEVTAKPADKAVGTTAASQKTHTDSVTNDRAKSEREKKYRSRLAEKWGADAGLLTDKEVAELDVKHPMRGLYGSLIAAKKRTAREVHKRLYTATLHEVMEIDAGGLSFADTEKQWVTP